MRHFESVPRSTITTSRDGICVAEASFAVNRATARVGRRPPSCLFWQEPLDSYSPMHRRGNPIAIVVAVAALLALVGIDEVRAGSAGVGAPRTTLWGHYHVPPETCTVGGIGQCPNCNTSVCTNACVAFIGPTTDGVAGRCEEVTVKGGNILLNCVCVLFKL